MNWNYIHITIALSATISMVALTIYIWRHRDAAGATAFAALTFLVTTWCVTDMLYLMDKNLGYNILWQGASFIQLKGIPVAWFAFTLQYTGRHRWLTPRRLIGLLIVPAITVLLVFNGGAYMFENGLIELRWELWEWVHVVYSLALLLAGVVLLVWKIVRSPNVYRSQMFMILLGASLPLTVNLLHSLELIPFVGYEYSTAFTVTMLMLAWSLFRYRLFDLAPVARDVLVDSMNDGMVVLDQQGRIVDLNPAARRILEFPRGAAIGHPAVEVLRHLPYLLAHLRAETPTQTEIAMPPAAPTAYYDLRTSPLTNRRGRQIGQLLVLYDITARKRAEQKLHAAHQRELAQMARELEIAAQIQRSLLPATAPHLPGLSIAGFSQAARQVGGDFYSYFVFDNAGVSDHKSLLGLAVGDVSGKGMQAALMMALSFGLLTNEMHTRLTPAALLHKLNLEIHPHTQRNRLNTALLYITIARNNAEWQIRCANAGLIDPLIRRSDGCIEWIETGGLPLGMFAGAEYEEQRANLRSGDVLILSSDGIVEATNDAGEMYGFDRLQSCIADVSQTSAHEVRESVLADVRAFVGNAEQHDDMTVIVVMVE